MNIKDTRGFTLVELLTVLVIIVILSGMTYELVASSSRWYRTVYSETEAVNEARVAMSYITVRIRQHDVSDCVDVVELSGIDQTTRLHSNALKLKEANGLSLWIYCAKDKDGRGVLREQRGQSFNPDGGSDVAEIDSLFLEKIDNIIYVEIQYNNGLVTKKLKESIILRSESE